MREGAADELCYEREQREGEPRESPLVTACALHCLQVCLAVATWVNPRAG
jgi:hypothetical protein